MANLVVVFGALLYVSALFAVAHRADQHALFYGKAKARPYIYAFAMAIYCTSWTFFGSIGMAVDGGLLFLSIYIGPILVMTLGHGFVRRMVRLGKSERSTSIADFIAARYGKSFMVACVATLIATIGIVPYIALQLKAIAGSVSMISGASMVGDEFGTHPIWGSPDGTSEFAILSLAIALLLALFAILFGTRHADATEHQDGLFSAIALESIIKLVAFLAVGASIVIGFQGGLGVPAHALMDAMTPLTDLEKLDIPKMIIMTALSAFAILVLPRQFHVTVVEYRDASELKTARWLFPLYLVAINLLVLPVATIGALELGPDAPKDFFMIAVPLARGDDMIAFMGFIGGLSAATAMVIVASVALSIMISNHIILPLIFSQSRPFAPESQRNWPRIILNIRRIIIVLILLAAFVYFQSAPPSTELASIGLLSFAAIAQLAPALIGGMIWRGANARGAVFGMVLGFAVWVALLLIPALSPSGNLPVFFGGVDPFIAGTLLSLGLNVVALILGSLSRSATAFERIQAAAFVPKRRENAQKPLATQSATTIGDVRQLVANYLGEAAAMQAFHNYDERNAIILNDRESADAQLIQFAEQLLGTAIGSSSARLILSILMERGHSQSPQAAQLLHDASNALQHNQGLLHTAMGQMGQGIAVFDRDFALTFWNDRFFRMLDIAPELHQQGLTINVLSDVLAARGDLRGPQDIRNFVEHLSAPCQPWRIDLTSLGRTVEINTNALPDGGTVTSCADVTDLVQAANALRTAKIKLEERVEERTGELTKANIALEQAQKQAERANMSKTRFLAAAGHDILQPLNAARLYAAALNEAKDDQARTDITANISAALGSVESILDAVLNISRLDTGVMKPRLTAVPLADILSSIANDFRPLAEERGVRLKVLSTTLWVETDRDLVRRLVQNLVSNAIKYSPGGRVAIGVRRRGQEAEVTVVDTGIGIADDDRKRAFDEFTRLDGGIRHASGLGLGLSIVQRIAGVLHADVSLTSKPGRGTNVTVTLPIAEQPEMALTEQALRPKLLQNRQNLAGMHIICIDNEPHILKGLKLLLEGWGCRVTTLTSSKDVQILAKQIDILSDIPNLVLADYHLIGETGLDLLTQLRDLYKAPLPACLITADRSAEVRLEAENMDADVLNKPIKPAMLRNLIAQHRPELMAAE